MRLPKFPPKLDEWKLGKPFEELPLPKWLKQNPATREGDIFDPELSREEVEKEAKKIIDRGIIP